MIAVLLYLSVTLVLLCAGILLTLIEIQQTMPTLTDLQLAVSDVTKAIDDAAQRVIDTDANAIPQETIDELVADKVKADGIAPAP